MSGQAPRQTIIIIKTYERARALDGWEGTENIPDKMLHCCLSHVRAKDSDRIQQASIKMPKFTLIGWFSGFSREVIQGHGLDDLTKLIAQNRNKGCRLTDIYFLCSINCYLIIQYRSTSVIRVAKRVHHD